MTSSLLPRKVGECSDSVHQQLNMYALAASAAGVSVLALASPCQAKIIYTPAHKRVVQFLTVDLNHDGKADIALRSSSFTNRGFRNRYLAGFASRGNDLVGEGSYASALKAGARIGSHQNFAARRALMAAWDSNGNRYIGQWMNQGRGVKNRYLGVKFLIKHNVHYGWVRLTVTPTKDFEGTLTGYAYETVPNKPIIAGKTTGPDDGITEALDASLPVLTPEPATLGMLALGAPALSIWRREESAGPARVSS